MAFPYQRNRRLRATEAIRDLMQEHHLRATDFIVPLFFMEGENKKEEIERRSYSRKVQQAKNERQMQQSSAIKPTS